MEAEDGDQRIHREAGCVLVAAGSPKGCARCQGAGCGEGEEMNEVNEEKTAKRRRTKGDGSVYRQGRFWWIQYQHPDGTRRKESTRSERRPVALRLLRTRIGAGANNLPVIARAEQLTFHDAAQAVINNFVANKKQSEDVVRRRIRLHLLPYFGGRRLIGITSPM